jgi:hypothetical protein
VADRPHRCHGADRPWGTTRLLRHGSERTATAAPRTCSSEARFTLHFNTRASQCLAGTTFGGRHRDGSLTPYPSTADLTESY